MKNEENAKVIPITVAPRGLHAAAGKTGKSSTFIPDKPFGKIEWEEDAEKKKESIGFVKKLLKLFR